MGKKGRKGRKSNCEERGSFSQGDRNTAPLQTAQEFVASIPTAPSAAAMETPSLQGQRLADMSERSKPIRSYLLRYAKTFVAEYSAVTVIWKQAVGKH
jgi:hypothetical protein